jgi:hypothetical protein
MMISKKITSIFALLLLLTFYNCANDSSKNGQKRTNESAQFTLLKSTETGLNFENVLTQDSKFNVFTYMYYFNGGGIATGDFNQDGLVDLYFTSNMSSNGLYLNKGDFNFEDVAEAAGVIGQNGWTAGATVVDINNDGMLDIYVSQMGDYQDIRGKNQLYVCQEIKDGIPVFEDQAAYYGLDFTGFATQAAFFDYDLDGDLDMYQLNHSLHANGTFGQRKSFEERHPQSGDKIFRNEDGKFIDVTEETGIYSTVIGYGLGITTGDMNLDGYPDIYIGNDFHENDYLYINQQNGTFKEVLREQMTHTSRFSMGVDMADLNNDGFNEVISLDMAPADPLILKSSLGEDTYGTFSFKLGYGYHPQYARNALQFNNQNNTFSEIGAYADVFATDWSWGPLFMDFDHDGYKDLFISNGIPRRMNDIDYIKFRSETQLNWKSGLDNLEEDDLKYVNEMPQIKLRNKFFKNKLSGKKSEVIQFQDLENQIANDATSYSNGAIYADLDNDGDLDIVVNNIDDAPYIYKNETIEKKVETDNYLKLKLKGSPKNINAIGAKILVFKGSEQLSQENFPTRGYQSNVEIGIHIGVGNSEKVDSVLLVWPDRTVQKLTNIAFNQTTEIAWKAGLPTFDFSVLKAKKQASIAFKDIAEAVNLNIKHKENPFVEFNREKLIPHMVSREGPAVAVGDVNGDGLEDVFFGSSKRERSTLYFQQKNGEFELTNTEFFVQDSVWEDVDAVFADLENDGDLDLVIASGGNEYKGENDPMKQRTYLNDGKGNFTRKDVFPPTYMTASCVLPADFNGDGLVDFFFGGRAVPWNYGKTPTSHLFENKGNGTFENVTEKYSEMLAKTGLVKNGNWADMDADGDLDLVLAIEWGVVQIYLNEGSKFVKKEATTVKGWWNFALPKDLDGDGDLDILVGNTGQNSKFKPTTKEPLKLYINDFDDNDQIEQILTYHLDGKEIPFANYEELTKQLVFLKKRYLLSKDFAKASLQEIFGKEQLKKSEVLEVNELSSVWLENTGDLTFKTHHLPDRLQLSTMNTAIELEDGNQFLIAGNFHENNIEMGRYNADYGNVLSFDTKGKMMVQPLENVALNGQVRHIKSISINGETCYIVVQNNGKTMVLKK